MCLFDKNSISKKHQLTQQRYRHRSCTYKIWSPHLASAYAHNWVTSGVDERFPIATAAVRTQFASTTVFAAIIYARHLYTSSFNHIVFTCSAHEICHDMTVFLLLMSLLWPTLFLVLAPGEKSERRFYSQSRGV